MVVVYMSVEEKQLLRERSQALGMSMSAYMRNIFMKPNRMSQEMIAREWISLALQLQKLQSGNEENLELKNVLDGLKALIQRTISK